MLKAHCLQSHVPPIATTPPLRATVAKLFGSYYVRVNGQLALGPIDQLRAHDHADRINKGVGK